jgi:hypothetical protein
VRKEGVLSNSTMLAETLPGVERSDDETQAEGSECKKRFLERRDQVSNAQCGKEGRDNVERKIE